MERKAFVIQRSTWYRGQNALDSYLLIPKTGMMCCLGSIALQCGMTAQQISRQRSPGALAQNGVQPAAFAPLQTKGVCAESSNTRIANQMTETNDNPDITDATREAELTRLAATIGWDLTFVD